MKYYLIDDKGKETILDTTKEELCGCIVDGHRYGFDTDEIFIKQNGEKFGITKIEKEYIGNITLQQLVDACSNDTCSFCKFYDFCERIEDYGIPKHWNLNI